MQLFSIFILAITILIAILVIIHRVTKIFVTASSKKYIKPTSAPRRNGKKVAIQMAIRNEDPEVVFRTIDSLLKQTYEDFVLVIIDNNTDDKSLWEPVEAFCEGNNKLIFTHVENLKGFKSGALNLALEITPEDCEIISVIDCDTIVDQDYLSDLIPFFDNPQIMVVQTPSGVQEEILDNDFTLGLGVIHRYFHSVFMTYAHSRRRVPFIGNMGIIRRSILEEQGQWNGKYLCEDMELSRRLILDRNESIFVDHAYGKTLLPSNLKNAKQQFYRWAFGNAQIFRDFFMKDMTTRTKLAMSYYPIPSIHANIFCLPYYIITILLLILSLFYSNQYLNAISFVILGIYIIEALGNLMTHLHLAKKEGFSIKTIAVSMMVLKSLSTSFSKGTYAVFRHKTMPFKITPHTNENQVNNNLYNLVKYFRLETLLSFAAIALVLINYLYNRSLETSLLLNAAFIILSSIFQLYLMGIIKAEKHG